MKILKKMLFSMETMVVLIVVFAVSIGIATFVEKDYGTEAAWALVYHATWFEILLCLLGINLIANLVKNRLWQKGKRFSLLFHASFIVILLGAALTRHFGFGGIMHIREGGSSDSILSDQTYLQIHLIDGDRRFCTDKPVLFSPISNNRFTQKLRWNGREVIVRYKEFVPKARRVMCEASNGIPMLLLTLSDGDRSGQMTLRQNEAAEFGSVLFAFGRQIPDSLAVVRFELDGKRFLISANRMLTLMPMKNPAVFSLRPGAIHELKPGVVYSLGNVQFALEQSSLNGLIQAVSLKNSEKGPTPENDDQGALIVEVEAGGQSQRISLFGSAGMEGEAEKVRVGGQEIELVYGSKRILIPFGLKLVDFQVDRYPGSSMPSGYTSKVMILNKEKGVEKSYRIFMNHTLKYRGYRFFQMSYDPDEAGTILLVTHDPGTAVVYAGFALLVFGLLAGLVSPGSRFRSLGRIMSRKNIRSLASVFLVTVAAILGLDNRSFADPSVAKMSDSLRSIDRLHAKAFGRLLVQDQNGRIKPVNTLSHELVHQLGGPEQFRGISPDQVALGMLAKPGIFDEKQPVQVFRFFPRPNDPSHHWATAEDAMTGFPKSEADTVARLFQGYVGSVNQAVAIGSWKQADRSLDAIRAYQVALSPGSAR